MSFYPTSFRPTARSGWGGKAASHWRGALSIGHTQIGITEYDPQTLGVDHWGQIGTLFNEPTGGCYTTYLNGVTRDSAGNPVGNVALDLFQGDRVIASTTSDASGNYSFVQPGSGPNYIVAYKVGSPDIAGTTVNTLAAV